MRDMSWIEQYTLRNNYVLVEWEDGKDTILDGKLAKPVSAQEANYTGIVLKCGSGCWPEIQGLIGKRVIFDRWSQTFLDNSGRDSNTKRYALILDSDIMGERLTDEEAEVYAKEQQGAA